MATLGIGNNQSAEIAKQVVGILQKNNQQQLQQANQTQQGNSMNGPSNNITGGSQAGYNTQGVITEGGIQRGDAAADQAIRWNAVNDKGAAAQFEGKAASYAWMLLNKAVDNAIKSLG